MTPTPQIRPSLWYCLLGVPFLLAGGGVFLYSLVHGILHLTDSLTQVVVPGKAELKLKCGETYTVFLERHSVVGGKIYSTTEPVAGLECRVRSLATGDAVRIAQPSGSTSYDVGGRSGRSVLEFAIQEDGRYEFACGYEGGSPGPAAVMAVGPGVGKGIFRTVAGSLVAAFAGGGLFLVVLLVVLFLRHRDGNRVRQLGP
jgi:hypothetical protein